MALLMYEDLKAKGITYSHSTVQHKSATGTFPKPVRSFDNRLRWRETDVDAWLAERREKGERI